MSPKTSLPFDKRSRKWMFVGIMTVSAPIFGGLQSYRKLRGQEDFLSDMVQVELVIAVGTLFAAFLFWTVLMRHKESPWRGGLAGLLTAICIVPLPVFGWSFRRRLMSGFSDPQSPLISDVFTAFFDALAYALPIFASKAVIALPLSFAVGYCVARTSPFQKPRA